MNRIFSYQLFIVPNLRKKTHSTLLREAVKIKIWRFALNAYIFAPQWYKTRKNTIIIISCHRSKRMMFASI